MDAIIDSPITDSDIQALRTEAAEAGDREQVELCTLALEGVTSERHARARRRCEAAIKSARAQHQDECDAG